MPAFRLAAAAVLSLGLPSLASAQPAALTIDLRSFSFAPTPIRLAAGRPVTLSFVNRSSGGHDFTAKAFFASSRILSGSAPTGRIEVRPRQAVTITLIPRAGSYSVHCSHFLHKQMGMSGLILVN